MLLSPGPPRRSAARLACAAALVGACALPPPTSLVVEIRAKPGARVASLSITINADGEPSRTVQAPEGGGPPPLPGTLVAQLPNRALSVQVRATGLLDDGTPVAAIGVTSAEPHKEVRLVLTLGIPQGGDGSGEPGQACAVPEDCAGGHCAGGVCCTTACDAPCATCLQAEGAAADGLCGIRAAGQVCRPADGACDVAEACTGTSTDCPLNQFRPAGAVCRPVGGACDVAESCLGTIPGCPPDASTCSSTDYCAGASCAPKKAAGAACGAPTECLSGFCTDGVCCTTACNAGPCDACSTAAGAAANGTCTYLSAAVVCRPAAGPCDQNEACDGVNGTCPPDLLRGAGASCRVAAGGCDLAETCTGTNANCPVDKLVAGGTVCRGSAGICDTPEACTGTTAACPGDAFLSGNVCRAAANGCDPAEACPGNSASCPADVSHRGLVAGECPAASSVPCNTPAHDACNNACGYNGTMGCTTCGTFLGPNCATPGAQTFAGPFTRST